MTVLELQVSAEVGAFRLETPELRISRTTAVVGPNGAGKTTLLRLLLGARRPSHGFVRCGGTTLFDSASRIDLPTDQRGFGYLPQAPTLFPHLDVLANVAFGVTGTRAARVRTARAQLEALGLAHLSARSVEGLSGGERQQVALARALAVRPRALLLDEPLASLDARTRDEVRGWLRARLSVTPLPVLWVTHDGRDLTELDAEVLALERGRVIGHGRAEEVREASSFVAALLSAR